MNKNLGKFLLIFFSLTAISGCSLNNEKVNINNSEKKLTNNLDSSHASNNGDINLIAYNFFFSQNKLIVKKDQAVNIELYSADGQHDLYIDGYNIQSTIVDTNNKTNIKFTADKVGEFEYYSTVGNQKELGLVGKLIVVE